MQELIYDNQKIKKAIRWKLFLCRKCFCEYQRLVKDLETVFRREFDTRVKDDISLYLILSKMQQKVGGLFDDGLQEFGDISLKAENANNVNEFVAYVNGFVDALKKYNHGIAMYEIMSQNLDCVPNDTLCKNIIVMSYFNVLFQRHNKLLDKMIDKNEKVCVKNNYEQEL